METRHCAVCGRPFQASVEGHRTKCEEHKGSRGTRRQALSASRPKYQAARPGERCTVVTGSAGTKCGKRGAVAFTGSGGERFVECAQHRLPGSGP